MVSERLPNLEELFEISLRISNQNFTPIHFPNVKNFKGTVDVSAYFKVLRFDHLEEISVNCDPNNCLQLTEHNKHVKRLTLNSHQFGKKLKDLMEFSLKNEFVISSNYFVQMINDSEHLNKLELQVPGDELFHDLNDGSNDHLKKNWSF